MMEYLQSQLGVIFFRSRSEHWWVWILVYYFLASIYCAKREISNGHPFRLKKALQLSFSSPAFFSRSHWVDIKLLFLMALVLGPLYGRFPGAGSIQQYLRPWINNPVPGPNPKFALVHTFQVEIIYTLVTFLYVEFCQYWKHWLKHHVSFLWAFHKVHHGSTTLSLFSATRNHPLERLFNQLYGALTLGLFFVVTTRISGRAPSLVTVAGILCFDWIHYCSELLRHSHFWISYAPFEKIVNSPRMHQIHHSSEPRHQVKNLARSLSLWDWVFGTLYLPQDSEAPGLRYGYVPEGGSLKRYDTFWTCLLHPMVSESMLNRFQKWKVRLRK